MGNIFELNTNNYKKKLYITDVIFSKEDIDIGNPYNSSAIINVVSYSFSGKSKFEFDIKSFLNFINDLESIYDNLTGTAYLQDISYGSYIKFEMEGLGSLNVKGTLFDDAKEQYLKFYFQTDQTALKGMLTLIKKWMLTQVNDVNSKALNIEDIFK